MAKQILISCALGTLAAAAFVSIITWWPLVCADLAMWLVRTGRVEPDLGQAIGMATLVLPFGATAASLVIFWRLKAASSERSL